jgi:aminotransferase
VAVIAGAAFGPGGERYIRISYAASDEALAQACRGIAKLMQQTQQQPLTEAL